MLKNVLEGQGVERIDRSDPMIGGFFDALRTLQPDRDGVRTGEARIALPFIVKPDPMKWLCAYEGDTAKILVVKMEGPTSRFAKSNVFATLTASRTTTANHS